MIDEALQDHCLSDATLRRLVSDRIYPDFAPASAAVPYILRSRLSNPPHDHLGGEAAIASPTSTYKEIVEAMGPGLEGGYFLYRFSDPTFIVADSHVVTGAQPAALWQNVIDELTGQ